MSKSIKKTYPKWLFGMELVAVFVIYLSLLIPFMKYFFYNVLAEHTVFIYVYLIIVGLAFVFFLITLGSGTYYSQKEKAYNTYRKKIHSFKKRGKYCSSLKYIIGLIIGFSFFFSILGMSIRMKVLGTGDEVFTLIAIIASLLGLFGFTKLILSGLFYSLLSSKRRLKRRKRDKTKETEVNSVEDSMAL